MTACPPILTFIYSDFIAQCPAYSDPTVYPEATLQQYWNGATNYVSNISNFGAIQCTARQFALNLMTAHLVFYAGLVANQQVPALMQTATIDKVSIGVTPPPLPNQWQWFLNISPYGQQLLAQLQSQSAGGFYIAGPYGGIRGYNPTYGYGYGGSL
jgi:hypothetical protein